MYNTKKPIDKPIRITPDPVNIAAILVLDDPFCSPSADCDGETPGVEVSNSCSSVLLPNTELGVVDGEEDEDFAGVADGFGVGVGDFVDVLD